MTKRATVIVCRENTNPLEVLLVKERRSDRWSLPGGRLSKGEGTKEASIRELREEVGLKSKHIEFLFHYKSSHYRHSIYEVSEYSGRVKLQRSELDDFVWVGIMEPLDLTRTTKKILEKFLNKISSLPKEAYLANRSKYYDK